MKKFIKVFLFLALMLIFTINASAASFDIDGYPVADIDGFPYSPGNTYLSTALTGTITDMNVHVWLGDSKDPGDTVLAWWTDISLSLRNLTTGIAINLRTGDASHISGAFNVTFDDDATSFPNPNNYYNQGAFLPEQSLSVFNGDQLAGAWGLEFNDVLSPSIINHTVILEWGINGTYNVSAVPEPATMLLLGSGIVGLAGFGRKKFKK